LWKIGRKLGFSSGELKDIQWLAVGPFQRVELCKTSSTLELKQSLKRKIERRWVEHLQKHPHDFPGPLASVCEIKMEGAILTLTLKRTDYKTYIATRWKKRKRLVKQRPLDREFPLPLSIGAVTVTEDNKIIVGIRERVGLARGLADTLPSGYFNPEEDARWEDCLVRELREEIGIEKFTKLKILGLIFDCKITQQPLLAVNLQLPFTSSEINWIGEETLEMIFIDNDINSIKERGYSWTPHARGKLILYFALS